MGKKKFESKQLKIENPLELGKTFPNIDKDTILIIDDMILQTDMYLPTSFIVVQDKDTVKKFIDLALDHRETEYMKAYIELFDKKFGILEPDLESWINHVGKYDFRYNNLEEQEKYKNWLKNKYQDLCDIHKGLLEESNPILADFFDHYKILTVEELVERYKDVRFKNKH